MSSAPADANLLFGLLALQMGFVTEGELLGGMKAWLSRRATPLGRLLVERQALTDRQFLVLQALMEEHVARHGSASRSLAGATVTPELARQLAELDDPELLSSLPPLTTPQNYAPHAGAAADSALAAPRYRKQREHARGGLGEVYVARDEELQREVALKEIQPHFADHPGARGRFVREAMVTGALEHPGVVPIYGLGAYPDGRPFYAMRFIKGETLHDAIQTFHQADAAPRRPGERELAMRSLLGRFVAVCNAIAYAHSRGVVHRDIKPGNVMLGDFGETLVVDWGLARLGREDDGAPAAEAVQLPGGSGVAATGAGDVVGTPAFMAPEQAMGWQARVGPPSDVYALGGVLYCLLTGKPPHASLAQAALGEVPPARQVNSRVPRALEAVCAKAMALRPEDRYGGARELAEEVERFLADEPLVAYREPLSVRLRRWSKRHRTLVSSASVFLVASVVGLALGLWAVNSERELTKKQRDIAEKAEADAKANLKLSEQNFALARRAVRECLELAKDEPQLQEEGLLEVRRALLEKAAPFYRKFREQRPADAELDQDGLEHRLWLGFIESEIGDRHAALKAMEEGLAGYARLAAAHPERHEYGLQASNVRLNLAGELVRMGKGREALKEYTLARDEWSRWAKQPGPHAAKALERLARAHRGLGSLHFQVGKLEGARAEIARACEVYAELKRRGRVPWWLQADYARANQLLASVLERQGRFTDALRADLRARELYSELASDPRQPTRAGVLRGLAEARDSVGARLMTLGRTEEGLKEMRLGRDAHARLADAFPTRREFKVGLAISHSRLGAALRGLSYFRLAETEYLQARAIQRGLVATWPEVLAFQNDLASTLNNLANLSRAQGRRRDAMTMVEECVRIQRRVAAAAPRVLEYQRGLYMVHHNLAVSLRQDGQPEQALRAYQFARDGRARLVRAEPANPQLRHELAVTLSNLGIVWRDLRRLDQALVAQRSALAGLDRLVRDHREVPEYRASLAAIYHLLGNLHADRRETGEAARAFERASELRRELVKARPHSIGRRSDLAVSCLNLGVQRSRLGQLPEALEALEEARALREQGLKARPLGSEIGPYRYDLALVLGDLAYVQWKAKRTEAGLASSTRAIQLANALREQDYRPGPAARLLAYAHATRARLRLATDKPRTALADWARAIALSGGARRRGYRAERAVALARLKEYRPAGGEARAVAANDPLSPGVRFELARACALCSAEVARDAAVPLPLRERMAGVYARRACEQLRLAAPGALADRRAELGGDDFAALRDRSDFRALVAALPAAKAPTPAEDD